MKYHQRKLQAALQAGTIAAVLTILLAASLANSDAARAALSPFRLARSGDGYAPWIFLLCFGSIIFWALAASTLFTSPAQDVRFARWLAERGVYPSERSRRLVQPDPSDAGFHCSTWKFFWARSRN